jgi:hypothetical protein
MRRMRHSLARKQTEEVGNVKYCGSIHTLRIPANEGGGGGKRVRNSVEIASEMWICIRYKQTNEQTKTNKKLFNLYIIYIIYIDIIYMYTHTVILLLDI